MHAPHISISAPSSFPIFLSLPLHIIVKSKNEEPFGLCVALISHSSTIQEMDATPETIQLTLILQLQGKIDQRVTWPDHICTCQLVQTTHYSLIMSNQDKTGCHGNHKQASFLTGIIWVHKMYRSYDNETCHSCHGHLPLPSVAMTTSVILCDWRKHLVLFCRLLTSSLPNICNTHLHWEWFI